MNFCLHQNEHWFCLFIFQAIRMADKKLNQVLGRKVQSQLIKVVCLPHFCGLSLAFSHFLVSNLSLRPTLLFADRSLRQPCPNLTYNSWLVSVSIFFLNVLQNFFRIALRFLFFRAKDCLAVFRISFKSSSYQVIYRILFRGTCNPSGLNFFLQRQIQPNSIQKFIP